MKLILIEFVSFDGVSQEPGVPDEDTSDGFTRGGSFVLYMDDAFIRLAASWMGRANAVLFGRCTYSFGSSSPRSWSARAVACFPREARQLGSAWSDMTPRRADSPSSATSTPGRPRPRPIRATPTCPRRRL
jgi:hypothetical protein